MSKKFPPIDSNVQRAELEALSPQTKCLLIYYLKILNALPGWVDRFFKGISERAAFLAASQALFEIDELVLSQDPEKALETEFSKCLDFVFNEADKVCPQVVGFYLDRTDTMPGALGLCIVSSDIANTPQICRQIDVENPQDIAFLQKSKFWKVFLDEGDIISLKQGFYEIFLDEKFELSLRAYKE